MLQTHEAYIGSFMTQNIIIFVQSCFSCRHLGVTSGFIKMLCVLTSGHYANITCQTSRRSSSVREVSRGRIGIDQTRHLHTFKYPAHSTYRRHIRPRSRHIRLAALAFEPRRTFLINPPSEIKLRVLNGVPGRNARHPILDKL
jgi:hypothetical protein